MDRPASRLAPGVIVDVLAQAGVQVDPSREKVELRCVLPHHTDRRASAVVFVTGAGGAGSYFCSGCGIFRTAKQLAQDLGIEWPVDRQRDPLRHPRAQSRVKPQFNPGPFWAACIERIRDDDAIEDDSPVYNFLERRGLSLAWDLSLIGSLPPDLHAQWYKDGFRLIAPLFMATNGELANVQGRQVLGGNGPKTKFPRDSRARGMVFGNPQGIEILRGSKDRFLPVVLCEGMTDALGIALAYGGPVLGVPGCNMARSVAGSWCRGRSVLLALDNDDAGEKEIAPMAEAIRNAGGHPRRIRWPRGSVDACNVIEQFGVHGLGRVFDAASGKGVS